MGIKMSWILGEVIEECAWDVAAMVREAAYFNWLNAGKPEGRDDEFWYAAERQEIGGTAEECYQWMIEIEDELRSQVHSY